jgi:hypothetical protein
VAVKQSDAGKPLFESRSLPVERDEPLRLEVESFLAAVAGATVKVSGVEGRRALALAVEIVGRIREHAERAGVPFAG